MADNNESSSGWYLTRLFHNEFKTIHIPKEGQIEIGRDNVNSCIPLSIPTFLHVSRKHCILQCTEGQAIIIDRFSKGGTYVSGTKISEARPGTILLKEGDMIGIGTHTNDTDHFYKNNPNVLFYRVCRTPDLEDLIVLSDDDDSVEDVVNTSENGGLQFSKTNRNDDEELERQPQISIADILIKSEGIGSENEEEHPILADNGDVQSITETNPCTMSTAAPIRRISDSDWPFVVAIPDEVLQTSFSRERQQYSWEEQYDRMMSEASHDDSSIRCISDDDYSDQQYSQGVLLEIKKESFIVNDDAPLCPEEHPPNVDCEHVFAIDEESRFNRWKEKLHRGASVIDAVHHIPSVNRTTGTTVNNTIGTNVEGAAANTGTAKASGIPNRRSSLVEFDLFDPALVRKTLPVSASPHKEPSNVVKSFPKRRASISEVEAVYNKKFKRRLSVSDRCPVKAAAKPVSPTLKKMKQERLKIAAEKSRVRAALNEKPKKTGSTIPRVKLTINNRGSYLTNPVATPSKLRSPSRPTLEEDIVCTQSTTLAQFADVVDEEDAASLDMRPAKMTFKSVERLSNVGRPAPLTNIPSRQKSIIDPSSIRAPSGVPISLGSKTNRCEIPQRRASISGHTPARQESVRDCSMGPPSSFTKPLEMKNCKTLQRRYSISERSSKASTMGTPPQPSTSNADQKKFPIKLNPTVLSTAIPLKGILKSPLFVPERDKSKSVVWVEERNEIFTIPRLAFYKVYDTSSVEDGLRKKEMETLSDILKWRAEWLQTNNDGPFEAGERLPQLVESYPNLTAYQKTLEPFLKREMWQDLRTQFLNMQQSLPWIELVGVRAQNIEGDLCQITCKVFINTIENQQLWCKDFGVLDYVSSQHGVCRQFAYIKECRRNGPPEWNGEPKPIGSGQWFDCVLYGSLRGLEGLRGGNKFSFAPITTLLLHFRLIKALQMLEFSPLLPNILSPVQSDHVIIGQGKAFFNKPKERDAIIARIKPGTLNEEQMDVVLSVLDECSNLEQPNISLIHGPPGTGKSRVISHLALELIRFEPARKLKVLVCAQSNTAVDVIAKRLMSLQSVMDPDNRYKLLRVGPKEKVDQRVHSIFIDELVRQTVDAKIAYQRGVVDLNGNLRETYQKDLVRLEYRIRKLEEDLSNDRDMNQSRLNEFYQRRARLNEHLGRTAASVTYVNPQLRNRMETSARMRLVEEADIVCTTLGSCAQLATYFKKAEYDVCIVDEATQCTEVYSLLPLLYGMPKLILVGDINQLPATVLDRASIDAGFRNSLFSRLHDAHGIDGLKMLRVQYRMHPEICRWPNGYFYKRKLKNDPSTIEGDRQSFPLRPYFVVSLSYYQELTQVQHEIYNRNEIEFVVGLLKGVVKCCRKESSIAVITPYQRHKNELVCQLRACQMRQVQVHSIDSVQGKEYDVVIVSLARSNGAGFLNSPERLNVALTRSRQCLVLCGNFSSLRQKPVWQSLLDDAERRGVYHHLVDDGEVDFIMERLRADQR